MADGGAASPMQRTIPGISGEVTAVQGRHAVVLHLPGETWVGSPHQTRRLAATLERYARGLVVGRCPYRQVTQEDVRRAAELYERMGVQEIADELGVSRSSLYRRMKHAGVQMRRPGVRGCG